MCRTPSPSAKLVIALSADGRLHLTHHGDLQLLLRLLAQALAAPPVSVCPPSAA